MARADVLWKELFILAGTSMGAEDARKLSGDSLLQAYYFSLRIANRSPETLRTYAGHLKQFVQYALSIGKPLTEMRKEDCTRWIAQSLDHLKPGSINSYVRSFKVFYSFLAEEGYIVDSPWRKIKLLEVDKELKPTLTEKEVAMILDTFPKFTFAGARDRAMILVAYDCMLRASEVLGLQMDSVDFQEGYIRVGKSKARRYRHVPMSAVTMRALHHYMYRFRDGLPGDLLFPTSMGVRLERSGLHLILRRAAKKAILHYREANRALTHEQEALLAKLAKVHPHMLRRSGATGYVINGGSREMVRVILGHSSQKVTDEYIQIPDDAVTAVHNSFSPAARLKYRAS